MECLWMEESSLDWIFKGPACAVLLINLIFLTSIMWVSSFNHKMHKFAYTNNTNKLIPDYVSFSVISHK